MDELKGYDKLGELKEFDVLMEEMVKGDVLQDEL